MNKPLQTVLTSALLCLAGVCIADEEPVRPFLARYYQALTQQDEVTLAKMISADAPVSIVLSPPDRTPVTLTLTREEYLQHLHALWKFSSSHHTQQSGLNWQANANGYRVTLDQQETFQLFGEQLTQHSAVILQLTTTGSGLLITGISSHSDNW